jgi:ribokinase
VTIPATGKVVVLGSVNVDLLVTAPRLPAAGETVSGTAITKQLGGKGANQAVGAARAGAPCLLVGAVGADEDGAAMTAAIAAYGVDVSHVRATLSSTGCAIVATSPQNNQIIHIAGANANVDAGSIHHIDLDPGTVCLAQMETPVAAIAALFRRARAIGGCTILNAAPSTIAARELIPICDILVVNEIELALLTDGAVGIDIADAELLSGREKLGLSGHQALVVTLGAGGLALAQNGIVIRIAGLAVSVVDTTGAGDCFCGYLAAGIARGDSMESAAREANVAASMAVQSLGAASSIPDRATVLRSMADEPVTVMAEG